MVQKKLSESIQAILLMAFKGELIDLKSEKEQLSQFLKEMELERENYLKLSKEEPKKEAKVNSIKETINLETLLRTSLKNESFLFSDIEYLFAEYDYRLMRDQFFKLIKDGVVNIEYRPDKKNYKFSFSK
ncbi:hypothetical protein [Flavisolibacter nicotianae]|uniref:hypothetical protein n=1 Tax=Flavisolibacter nicotianae TaxID=2364882 RepID=UPI001F09A7A8|nr:hypothetical protein [Flavisolibacter nicotianae]